MYKRQIDLCELTPHGKAAVNYADGALDVWTTHSITPIGMTDFDDRFKVHYVALPETYRLPFRVDMTVKLDFPALYLLIGSGHITFASRGDDNRKLEDIVKHTGKPNQDRHSYDNRLPFGSYVDLSVTCNLDEMQILIGGEERFYSHKQPYMKAKNLSEVDAEGFSIGLAVSKGAILGIKAISVTEGEGNLLITRGAFEEAKPPGAAADRPKPTLDSILSGLPQQYQDALNEMEATMTAMRPLRFRRTIDKGGRKIAYVAADHGVSYAIEVFGDQFMHCFNWYIVYNGKPETWHRKADYMEDILDEIAKSDPQLSGRIFYALNDCIGCHGDRCLAKTLYSHRGEKRLTCHGRVILRMCEGDLRDAKAFFHHLNKLIEGKIANGAPPPEKILLAK